MNVCLKLAIGVTLLLQVSCRLDDNRLRGRIFPSTPASHPPAPLAIELGDIPEGNSFSPSVSITSPSENSHLVENYEARVHISSSDLPITDWIIVNSGSVLSGLSLDPIQAYHIEVRAIGSSGHRSGSIVSEKWLPDSLGCKGKLLTASPYARGDGSIESPFEICTVGQLNNIGLRSEEWAKRFELRAHIDMSGVDYNVIGTTAPYFTGHFNGRGKTIFYFTQEFSDPNIPVGLFHRIGPWSQISNLVLESPSVKSTDKTHVGVLVGEQIQHSQILNISIENAEVIGRSRVGILVGGTCSLSGIYNFSISGTVVAHGDYAGGLIGQYDWRCSVVNGVINTSVSGVATVGGVTGYASGIYQNLEVTTTVIGETGLGGLSGFADGFILQRSQVYSALQGTSIIGGLTGAQYSYTLNLLSNRVHTDISGEESLGGLVGSNWDRGYLRNNSVTGSISTQAPGQAAGGLVGHSYFTWTFKVIENNLVNMTVATPDTDRVGGFIGNVTGVWTGTTSIAQNVFLGNVAGSSLADSVSSHFGYNQDGPPTETNYYWSGATCVNSLGACNTLYATPIADQESFFSKASIAYTDWDFDSVWQENSGALPTLRMEQLHPPVVSHSCPTTIAAENAYNCSITVMDEDVFERRVKIFTPNHSCRWMTFNRPDTMSLVGTPATQDVSSCQVSFYVTDGVYQSPVQEFTLTVVE